MTGFQSKPLHCSAHPHACSPGRRRRNLHRSLLHKLRRSICRYSTRLAVGQSRVMEPTTTNSMSPPNQSLATMGSAICAFGVFLHKFLKASFLPLAAFYRALFLDTEVEPGCGCSRNLFPLPRIVVWPSDLECEASQLDAHLCCANLRIAGLNFLEQGMPKRASSAPMPRRCSAAQASCSPPRCRADAAFSRPA